MLNLLFFSPKKPKKVRRIAFLTLGILIFLNCTPSSLEQKLNQGVIELSRGNHKLSEKHLIDVLEELSVSQQSNRNYLLKKVFKNLIYLYSLKEEDPIKEVEVYEKMIASTLSWKEKNDALIRLEEIYKIEILDFKKAQRVQKLWVDKFATFELGHCPKESYKVLDYSLFLLRTDQDFESYLKNAVKNCFSKFNLGYFSHPLISHLSHPYIEAKFLLARFYQKKNPKMSLILLEEAEVHPEIDDPSKLLLWAAMIDSFKMMNEPEESKRLMRRIERYFEKNPDLKLEESPFFVPDLEKFPKFYSYPHPPNYK